MYIGGKMRAGLQRFLCAAVSVMMLSACGSSATSASGIYQPGTYQGSSTGMGAVTASVTVDANKITGVELDLSNETESIGQKAGDTLKQQILDSQGADIDGVSGATVTSTAVKEAVAAALSQAKGSSAASDGKMKPGTYTGTAHGSRSDITVEVEVDASSIKSVKVTDSHDSPYIGDTAIEKVPQQIVDAQSLSVDGVTGATLTTGGIVSATSKALQAAGANISDWSKKSSTEKQKADDVNVDVLVVGGGASGLTAALAAKTDSDLSSADSGLNVMVVESNGYGGGNLALCGGYVASYYGTALNDKTGNSWDPDQLAETLEASHPDLASLTNDYVLRQIIGLNAKVLNGLMNRGFYLSADDAYSASSTGLSADGSVQQYTSSSVVANPETGERSGDNGYDVYGGGAYLGKSLTELVEKAGVNLQLETKATSLIMEGNTCKGVTVETPHSTYSIYAKKVILSSGYAGFDEDTIKQFLPAEYANVINAQNISNQSFAQKQIAALGGDTVKLLQMGYSVPGYNTVLAHYGKEGQLYRNMNAVWVNSSGQRFMDETAPDSGRGPETGAKLMEQDGGRAWIIFDSRHEGVQFYDFLSQQGLAWKADTIEDLASQAGLPADQLKKTIDQYNADAEASGDTQYSTAKDKMVPVTDGPFYAVKIGASSPAGVDVSLYGGDHMEVLLHQDGAPIENLYGAGGVLSNGYIILATVGLGTHVNASLLSGAYAGNCVREALTGK